MKYRNLVKRLFFFQEIKTTEDPEDNGIRPASEGTDGIFENLSWCGAHRGSRSKGSSVTVRLC
jgi:hypothetical protein